MFGSFGGEIIIHIHFNKTLQDYLQRPLLRMFSSRPFRSRIFLQAVILHLARAAQAVWKAWHRWARIWACGAPHCNFTDTAQMAVSSSRIRAALQAGQIGLAADMLGRQPTVSGPIIMGISVAGLDFPQPTLNLAVVWNLPLACMLSRQNLNGLMGSASS